MMRKGDRMPDILEYLKNNQTKMEETLLRLVQAESPSKDKNLVDLCGNVLQQEFEDLVG
jgi:glutamate carboxypeptidase